MKLNDFLNTNDLTMAKFAADVGTTTATISRIADRSVMPRRSLIQRIYDATDGLVTPNDLAGLYCKIPCRQLVMREDQQRFGSMPKEAVLDQQ